jgi:Na+-driven multidrug efflux pump
VHGCATFVLGLRLGLAGSGWGTVIAQSVGAAAYLVVVARGARRAGVGLGMDLAGLRSATTAAAGLIVRTLALQTVLVVSTAVAARQGVSLTVKRRHVCDDGSGRSVVDG